MSTRTYNFRLHLDHREVRELDSVMAKDWSVCGPIYESSQE